MVGSSFAVICRKQCSLPRPHGMVRYAMYEYVGTLASFTHLCMDVRWVTDDRSRLYRLTSADYIHGPTSSCTVATSEARSEACVTPVLLDTWSVVYKAVQTSRVIYCTLLVLVVSLSSECRLHGLHCASHPPPGGGLQYLNVKTYKLISFAKFLCVSSGRQAERRGKRPDWKCMNPVVQTSQPCWPREPFHSPTDNSSRSKSENYRLCSITIDLTKLKCRSNYDNANKIIELRNPLLYS